MDNAAPMGTALKPPRLASQPRHGVGARLLRRFGGVVRNAIAGSLVLAGALRQPASPQPGTGHAAPASAAACPSAGPARLPRRPRTAPPVPPSRPARAGWLMRFLHRNRPARPARHLFPDNSDAPFTPEAFPGLTQEACAFFNTPLEECDPRMIRIVLSALAESIAGAMPPGVGGPDAGAVFATLWGRMADTFDQARLDALPRAMPFMPVAKSRDLPAAAAQVPSRSSVPPTHPPLPARPAAGAGTPAASPGHSTVAAAPLQHPDSPASPLPETDPPAPSHADPAAAAADIAPGAAADIVPGAAADIVHGAAVEIVPDIAAASEPASREPSASEPGANEAARRGHGTDEHAVPAPAPCEPATSEPGASAHAEREPAAPGAIAHTSASPTRGRTFHLPTPFHSRTNHFPARCQPRLRRLSALRRVLLLARASPPHWCYAARASPA